MAKEYTNIIPGSAWVVSYWDEGDNEATVTVFMNKEAGEACFKAFLDCYDHVQIDECPVYMTFIVEGVAYGEEKVGKEREE